jgi:glutathione synthase/RimK-type ligase-like ATP-grasp enzyme
VATSAEFPELLDDWPLLRAALEECGVTASTRVWTEPDVRWSEFDLVLANGAWDNIHHPHEFLQWAERVATVTRLVNAPAVLRWSMDKRYLSTLADAGVPIVPTLWLDASASDATADMELPQAEFVVKPSISGGGFESARYGPTEHSVARTHVDRLHAAGRTVMVQPYVATVDARGETGLIFLAGEFSHAIAKGPLLHPGAGAQSHLWENEQITATAPSDAELTTAQAALAVAHELLGQTTYARVDLLANDDGTPVVLELELLDPALFLDTDPAAASRFAYVLQQLIPQLPSG